MRDENNKLNNSTVLGVVLGLCCFVAISAISIIVSDMEDKSRPKLVIHKKIVLATVTDLVYSGGGGGWDDWSHSYLPNLPEVYDVNFQYEDVQGREDDSGIYKTYKVGDKIEAILYTFDEGNKKELKYRSHFSEDYYDKEHYIIIEDN